MWRGPESLGGPGIMNPETKGRSWGEYTSVSVYRLPSPKWKSNLPLSFQKDSRVCQELRKRCSILKKCILFILILLFVC